MYVELLVLGLFFLCGQRIFLFGLVYLLGRFNLLWFVFDAIMFCLWVFCKNLPSEVLRLTGDWLKPSWESFQEEMYSS
ncbi:small hydrophobic protein [Durham virus]|uniref:Small hydrophobic protein n=1 Tax=Durham virus TaxID=710545 RepID=D6C4E7_9RHAB|nr:small hydrophobic protein [Durham virus]ADB88762.1 small hydrophobic protein [Durham virus]